MAWRIISLERSYISNELKYGVSRAVASMVEMLAKTVELFINSIHSFPLPTYVWRSAAACGCSLILPCLLPACYIRSIQPTQKHYLVPYFQCFFRNCSSINHHYFQRYKLWYSIHSDSSRCMGIRGRRIRFAWRGNRGLLQIAI